MAKSYNELLELVLENKATTDFNKNLDRSYLYDPAAVANILKRLNDVEEIDIEQMNEAYDNKEFVEARDIATRILDICKETNKMITERAISELYTGDTPGYITDARKAAAMDFAWRDCKHIISRLATDAKNMIKKCKSHLESGTGGYIRDRLNALKKKTVNKKIDKLQTKINKLKKKSDITESADNTLDLQLDIFEACESGNITEEDRDDLLELLKMGGVFSEASHSKLKYDFRLAFDINTMHTIKIVYSLNDIQIDEVKMYSGNKQGEKVFQKYIHSNDSSENEFMQKNITKTGSTNHSSHGQKVLAIVDTITNKNLRNAECIGIFDRRNIPDEYLSGNSTELRKKIKELNLKIFKVKVGEVDTERSYKSTFFPKKGSGAYPKNNTPEDWTNMVEVREMKSGRAGILNKSDKELSRIRDEELKKEWENAKKRHKRTGF